MSSLRELFEKREEDWLSPYAVKSKSTLGRIVQEKPCDVRTAFQRDRDRVIHSKAFRRLKHKTQVFISPEGDHFRTRLTHTLEVSQIARTAARALRLNEDLAEAISLSHDLGHTPFGHAGETALNQVHPGGFKHNIQSLRVVDKLELGTGLNLTWEVRDGIVNHTGDVTPSSLEGQIVKIADRIAYINHDIDDAIRGRVMSLESLPKECLKVLGFKHSERINKMVRDMIDASWDKPYITMSKEVSAAMDELRQFLFRNVYIGSLAKTEEKKAMRLVQEIYHYYCNHPQEISNEYKAHNDAETNEDILVIDYIAGMTDRYAIAIYQKLFVPSGFSII
ncbi:deoxyguanosinetriphosphate triphosphohydrolase [Desulfitibacter alkalitolerans]|uniref:deoxyguanosinetriphosphate triphosphohydrolase n=1 Tax=Desulfitibacter alkalitolerans TaxID=264641 RepID=UPI0004880AFE|nr:deoxyguanosinetriphosphate triphosphohydrolase [Desulfitibacter alkalitolerans]